MMTGHDRAYGPSQKPPDAARRPPGTQKVVVGTHGMRRKECPQMLTGCSSATGSCFEMSDCSARVEVNLAFGGTPSIGELTLEVVRHAYEILVEAPYCNRIPSVQ